MELIKLDLTDSALRALTRKIVNWAADELPDDEGMPITAHERCMMLSILPSLRKRLAGDAKKFELKYHEAYGLKLALLAYMDFHDNRYAVQVFEKVDQHLFRDFKRGETKVITAQSISPALH